MNWQRVTIERAVELGQQGKWIDNPKYVREGSEPKEIFAADYIVYMRPEPDLPESEQYALVARI